MKIHECTSYEIMSKIAAQAVSEQIRMKPGTVLGLPTGSTPTGMYRELVELHRRGEIDFSAVKTFNLDEYSGLPSNHPSSYAHFMDQHLFKHVGIMPGNIHIPSGTAVDPWEECRKYDRLIREAGDIDLLILGIGANGHIGFNEPGGRWVIETHPVQLSLETRRNNSRFFPDGCQTPPLALTMGIGSIMRADRILLLAAGPEKRAVLQRLLEKRISTDLPASILHLHPHVTLLADREALAEFTPEKAG